MIIVSAKSLLCLHISNTLKIKLSKISLPQGDNKADLNEKYRKISFKHDFIRRKKKDAYKDAFF